MQKIKKKQLFIQEDGIPVGNVERKYATNNPLTKYLVNRFLNSIETLTRKVNPPNIHEVGCGEGLLTISLARKFPDCPFFASDFSNQIIDIAKENKTKQNINSSIFFYAKSIYDLEPNTDSASLIICCEVLEHLNDPEQALQKLVEITNEFVILSVPREPLWRLLNIVRGKYLGHLGNTPGHIQHWSKKDFLRLLSHYFEIVEVHSPVPWTIVLCKRKT
jgi:2-polyprenyl-3-methyl-5-hydroxy-6-metoxy-1,4-benzoquinol methylase